MLEKTIPGIENGRVSIPEINTSQVKHQLQSPNLAFHFLSQVGYLGLIPGVGKAIPGIEIRHPRRTKNRNNIQNISNKETWLSENHFLMETERLEIRLLCLSDAEFILDLMNGPGYLKYIGDRGVRDLDTAREYLETSMIKSYELHGFGLYLLSLRKDRVPVGICGFVKRDALPAPDLGFAILEEYEGQGYVSEACRALLHYADETLGFTSVLAITSQDNESSKSLCKKLGFRGRASIELNGQSLLQFELTLNGTERSEKRGEN